MSRRPYRLQAQELGSIHKKVKGNSRQHESHCMNSKMEFFLKVGKRSAGRSRRSEYEGRSAYKTVNLPRAKKEKGS